MTTAIHRDCRVYMNYEQEKRPLERDKYEF